MDRDKEKLPDTWMPQIRPIVWNDSFVTGIQVIDDQHRILVNIINDVYQGLDARYSRVSLQRIMLELRGYVSYHFGAEEKLMSERNFGLAHPDEYETHLQQHRDFTERLVKLEQLLHHNKPIYYEDLFIYLRDWLANHILGTDKKLADILNQSPSSSG